MDKLQEWLKDKKNQPIVAGVLILVLVVAGVVVWKSMNPSDGGAEMSQSVDATMPEPTAPPGSRNPALPPTGTPPTGGTPPSAAPPTGAPVANAPSAAAQPKPVKAVVKPVVKKVVTASVLGRKDPFLPVGWTPPPPPRPRGAEYVQVPDTTEVMPRWIKTASNPVPKGGELQQPPRRMAGLLLNGRIYAIIESNGSTELVQPGDMLKDRLAVVDRIDRDKVVLKTTVGEKRYIIVRMAAASKQDAGATNTNTVTPNSGANSPMRLPPGYMRGPGNPGGGLPRM